jgi:hypothetical protein
MHLSRSNMSDVVLKLNRYSALEKEQFSKERVKNKLLIQMGN